MRFHLAALLFIGSVGVLTIEPARVDAARVYPIQHLAGNYDGTNDLDTMAVDMDDSGRFVLLRSPFNSDATRVLDRRSSSSVAITNAVNPLVISGDGSVVFGLENQTLNPPRLMSVRVGSPQAEFVDVPANFIVYNVDSDYTGRFVTIDGAGEGGYVVYLLDTVMGTSVSLFDGLPADTWNALDEPAAVTPDGRFVAFSAQTHSSCGAAQVCSNVWVYDRIDGSHQLASISPSGDSGNGPSHNPSISADGHHVVFLSEATNLAPGTTTARTRVFERDLGTGTTDVVSGTVQAYPPFTAPAINSNGERVAFATDAPIDHGGALTSGSSAFVWTNGVTDEVTVDAAGGPPNNILFPISKLLLSNDGSTIVLTSFATNLDAGRGGVFAATLPSVASGRSLPLRFLDTRHGGETLDGQFSGGGLRPADSTLEVQIGGRGSVPSGATSVVLNVTAVSQGDGYITVWPCGERPPTSNLNVVAGQIISNSVVTKLSATGTVCLYSQAPTDLIVDGQSVLDSGFVPLASPVRLLDTRASGTTVDGQSAGGGTIVGDSSIRLRVSGRGGMSTNARTAVLNVTAVGATQAGYLTIWPCAEPRPLSSNLNYASGAIIPNAVVTGLSSSGDLCIYSSATTHVIVDGFGELLPTAYAALDRPVRLADSREGSITIDGEYGGGGIRTKGSVLTLQISGRGGIPASARTAVLNVTVDQPVDNGYVTMYPCDAPRPTVSNVNFAPNQTLPNLVVARLSATGSACIYASVDTHVIVDGFGSLILA